MWGSTTLLTADGKAKLRAELDHLRDVRRREVAEQLHVARQLSDGWDSPEYLEAKNVQSFVEGRIRTLEKMLAEAAVVDYPDVGDKRNVVAIGTVVRVLNDDDSEEEFRIVGSVESNARMGRISNESPVGRALLGAKVGDNVEVEVPEGVRRFVVLGIE